MSMTGKCKTILLQRLFCCNETAVRRKMKWKQTRQLDRPYRFGLHLAINWCGAVLCLCSSLLHVTLPAFCLLQVTLPAFCLLQVTLPAFCLLYLTLPAFCLLHVTLPAFCLLLVTLACLLSVARDPAFCLLQVTLPSVSCKWPCLLSVASDPACLLSAPPCVFQLFWFGTLTRVIFCNQKTKIWNSTLDSMSV